MKYENNYDDYKKHPEEIYQALEPFTRHLPEEERREAAERMMRYLEIVIEQVDEKEGWR